MVTWYGQKQHSDRNYTSCLRFEVKIKIINTYSMWRMKCILLIVTIHYYYQCFSSPSICSEFPVCGSEALFGDLFSCYRHLNPSPKRSLLQSSLHLQQVCRQNLSSSVSWRPLLPFHHHHYPKSIEQLQLYLCPWARCVKNCNSTYSSSRKTYCGRTPTWRCYWVSIYGDATKVCTWTVWIQRK